MDVMTLLRSQWDRLAGGGLILIGFIALIVGYHGVATSAYIAEELSYVISGGIGGLFCLGLGAALLLTADLHDEWRKLDRIEAAILSTRADPSASPNGHGETGLSALDLRAIELAGEPLTTEIPVITARPTRRAPRPATRRTTGAMNLSSSIGARPRGSLAGGAAATPAPVLESLRLTLGGALAALVGLIVAWTKAANVAQTRPALEATAGAVLAIVGLGLVVTLGTLQLKRRSTLRTVELLRPWIATAINLERSPAARSTGRSAAVRSATSAVLEGDLLLQPGTHFAHRPGCAMLAAGATTLAVSAAHLPDGVTACGLCELVASP